MGRFWRGAYFSSFAPLQVRNVPRQPLPEANWVRVRNRLAGICGSDLHLVYADGDFRIAPAALPGQTHSYPGHEVVGEVIEVGEDVQHLRAGDRVTLQYGPNCITGDLHPFCRACASGNYQLCERSHIQQEEPIGGGWSEEMLLHEQQLFRVPDALTDEQAVLLEPTAVALHAVLRRLPQPGEQVLIIGAGTIGLLILQVIRVLAPQARVHVMARHAFQIEQATRLGAEQILYPQDTYNAVVRATGARLYKGMFGNKMLLGGYDLIFDTIGTKRTLQDSLRWTRAGGTIVLVGVHLHPMKIDLTPTWFQEVSILGSTASGTEYWPIGTTERRSTFEVAARLIEQGLLHPEKLITHRFALTDFREALQTASGKSQTRAIKVVFDYSLLPATVVPNVRAAGRQRRSGATSAVLPVPAEEEGSDSGEWEAAGEPVGQTWSKQVQPLPTIAEEPLEDDEATVVVKTPRYFQSAKAQQPPESVATPDVQSDAMMPLSMDFPQDAAPASPVEVPDAAPEHAGSQISPVISPVETPFEEEAVEEVTPHKTQEKTEVTYSEPQAFEEVLTFNNEPYTEFYDTRQNMDVTPSDSTYYEYQEEAPASESDAFYEFQDEMPYETQEQAPVSEAEFSYNEYAVEDDVPVSAFSAEQAEDSVADEDASETSQEIDQPASEEDTNEAPEATESGVSSTGETEAETLNQLDMANPQAAEASAIQPVALNEEDAQEEAPEMEQPQAEDGTSEPEQTEKDKTIKVVTHRPPRSRKKASGRKNSR
jgi:2-desacetyl-2-hydroxyethyl bacteriochlorophyllide A dehydrogenase